MTPKICSTIFLIFFTYKITKTLIFEKLSKENSGSINCLLLLREQVTYSNQRC